jgi:hypothetical protein
MVESEEPSFAEERGSPKRGSQPKTLNCSKKPGARIFVRSTSFVPLRVQTARQNFFAKKKNESRGLPPLARPFVRLSTMEETKCRKAHVA